MRNIELAWLADEFHDAGLAVVEVDGWDTFSMPTANTFDPVGLLNHHTAGSSILYNYPNPPYWPLGRLQQSCNYTIRPNGVVEVVNAGYAYDSGQGDPAVLDRIRNGEEPKTRPDDRTSDDRVTGNPWFIDVEVQHLGNGTPIVAPQREALIISNAVVCNHYGWDPMVHVLGHLEWTRRKIDPRWEWNDKRGYQMPQIRIDTKEVEMVTRNSKADEGLDNLAENFQEKVSEGVFSSATQPGGVTFNDELATFLERFENHLVNKYGLNHAVDTGLHRGDTVTLT